MDDNICKQTKQLGTDQTRIELETERHRSHKHYLKIFFRHKNYHHTISDCKITQWSPMVCSNHVPESHTVVLGASQPFANSQTISSARFDVTSVTIAWVFLWVNSPYDHHNHSCTLVSSPSTQNTSTKCVCSRDTTRIENGTSPFLRILDKPTLFSSDISAHMML